MFCTTECWSCEDKSCEHYVSKEKLYFENKQLKDRINKAIEYIEDKGHHYDIDGDGFYDLGEEEQMELLEILKGDKKCNKNV